MSSMGTCRLPKWYAARVRSNGEPCAAQAVMRSKGWGAASTLTKLPSSATNTSPPRTTWPRCKKTDNTRPLESSVWKRLFCRTSQSNDTVGARLIKACARPLPPEINLEQVSIQSIRTRNNAVSWANSQQARTLATRHLLAPHTFVHPLPSWVRSR